VSPQDAAEGVHTRLVGRVHAPAAEERVLCMRYHSSTPPSPFTPLHIATRTTQNSFIGTALEDAASSIVSEIASAHRQSGGSAAGAFSSGGPFGSSAGAGVPNLFSSMGGFGGGGGGADAAPAAADAQPPGSGVCASPAALCRAAGVALVNPALEDSGGYEALEALAKAVVVWPADQRLLLVRLLRRWDAAAMGR